MSHRLHASADAIRPAGPGDFKAITAMRHDLTRQSHRERPDTFRPMFLGLTEATYTIWLNTPDHIVMVIDVDAGSGSASVVAGFASVWIGTPQDSDIMFPTTSLFIGEIVVAEAFRRRGIGRLLFRAVEAEGRRLGVEAIGLSVNTPNTEARAFYDSLGYAPQGEYRRKPLRKVVRMQD
jgi:ribosomal protein S18 acetylase RimI-like enzyme